MKLFPFLAAAGLIARAAAGQAPNLIDIETDNGVFYAYDTADSTKFATLPGVVGPWSATPGVASRNFWSGVYIADIVLVNGRPARGVMVRRGTRISLAASAGSGQAIADAAGNFIDDGVWVFQREDGTTFGTITTHGLIGGGPSQGAPALAANTNLAVTGGTGAYYGARGQMTATPPASGNAGPRTQASITEDPANRRANGGSRSRFLLQLTPDERPEIALMAGGPAVVHGRDGSPVTAASPASRGEALTLYARGLGPTTPNVEIGQAFATSARAVVNAPVAIYLNQTRVDAIYAGGYPGSSDGYQVNFVVPDTAVPGTRSLQLSVAWVNSAPVEIAVK
jgi:uncharacterized protein (TIGR03437 family)